MHLASFTPETINTDFEVLKPQSDVEEINSLYADVCEASRPAFEKAIELGRLLNRAKKKAGRLCQDDRLRNREDFSIEEQRKEMERVTHSLKISRRLSTMFIGMPIQM